jgi:hypothetical protein
LLDQGLLLERLVWVVKTEQWMLQDKSKGKNCFGNTNITGLECGTAPLSERFTIWFSGYWFVRLCMELIISVLV